MTQRLRSIRHRSIRTRLVLGALLPLGLAGVSLGLSWLPHPGGGPARALLSAALMLAAVGCALVLATLAGVLVGYVVTRRQSADSKLLDFLVMIPFVVPGTVLGIGYASVFNGPPLLLTGSAAIMVIVYFVRRLPYVVRSSASMVHQIDVSLEEASASLGEKPMAGFRRIMVPLMRPGILAGVVIAWLEIFNELSATMVLYTGATRTLPIAAYQQAFGGDFGVAAVYSSLLILITALTLGLALKLGKMDEQNF